MDEQTSMAWWAMGRALANAYSALATGPGIGAHQAARDAWAVAFILILDAMEKPPENPAVLANVVETAVNWEFTAMSDEEEDLLYN